MIIMTTILPQEIIDEVLIFLGDLKICIKIKNNYSANKVYNEKQHSYLKVCEKGELEVLKWLHFNNKNGCTDDAMDSASENGHLEVVPNML